MCSAGTEEFLRRPGVPVHQNLLMADATAARETARGTLALHVCGGCGFVFNADLVSVVRFLDVGTWVNPRNLR